MSASNIMFFTAFFNTQTRIAAREKNNKINIFYYLPETYEAVQKIVIHWKKNKSLYRDIKSIRILAVISALNYCSIVPLALLRYSVLLTKAQAAEICASFGMLPNWQTATLA